ncbi:prolyl-tRNA synthetase associated domain-containing protein [Roseomonas sp. CCTCC AB2023176]|uniref:prolyl-tRNA synthetase associated domain-containing protein n=1 Tax=Roseomonas sp. CCTCC AB2023176 TaxID=3342640 RepID=UPI0035D7A6F7
MPETPESLLARLESLGIPHVTHRHPPLHTVAESQALRGTLPGWHVRNLFLRPKNPGPFLLVTVEEETPLSINALARQLGMGRVSMASAEDLQRVLAVAPGSVTPLALVNANPGEVRAVMDRRLMSGDAPVNVHPLTNTATTALAPADLLRILALAGHAPEPLDLPLP